MNATTPPGTPPSSYKSLTMRTPPTTPAQHKTTPNTTPAKTQSVAKRALASELLAQAGGTPNTPSQQLRNLTLCLSVGTQSSRGLFASPSRMIGKSLLTSPAPASVTASSPASLSLNTFSLGRRIGKSPLTSPVAASPTVSSSASSSPNTPSPSLSPNKKRALFSFSSSSSAGSPPSSPIPFDLKADGKQQPPPTPKRRRPLQPPPTPKPRSIKLVSPKSTPRHIALEKAFGHLASETFQTAKGEVFKKVGKPIGTGAHMVVYETDSPKYVIKLFKEDALNKGVGLLALKLLQEGAARMEQLEKMCIPLIGYHNHESLERDVFVVQERVTVLTKETMGPYLPQIKQAIQSCFRENAFGDFILGNAGLDSKNKFGFFDTIGHQDDEDYHFSLDLERILQSYGEPESEVYKYLDPRPAATAAETAAPDAPLAPK